MERLLLAVESAFPKAKVRLVFVRNCLSGDATMRSEIVVLLELIEEEAYFLKFSEESNL